MQSAECELRACFRVRPGTVAHRYERARSGAWTLLLTILAIKPLIDLTWDIEILNFGDFPLNGPRLTGVLVFLLAVYEASKPKGRRCMAQFWILTFIACQLTACTMGFGRGDVRLSYFASTLLRTGSAYAIYFAFSRYWVERRQVRTLSDIIWISNLVCIFICILAWWLGVYNTNLTSGVSRLAGLHHDAGGLSYSAIICVAFCLLSIELRRFEGVSRSGLIQTLVAATLLANVVVLYLCMCKTAFVMAAVLVIMWWGIYQRHHFLVLLAIPTISYCMFVESEDFRTRLAPEMKVFVEGDYSENALNSLGTGRFGLWERCLRKYARFPIVQKYFGHGYGFGAHNQYILYLLEVGFVGLTVFCGMLASFLHALYRNHIAERRPENFMAVTLLVLFMTLGITGHPFGFTTHYWYLLILLSLLNAPTNATARDYPGGASHVQADGPRAVLA